MLYPIAYAMHYPHEPGKFIENTDLLALPDIRFLPIEQSKFPGFFLGLQAGRQGGYYPAVFNAANEEAVKLFLADTLPFQQIVPQIESALSACPFRGPLTSIDELLEADEWAREHVHRQAQRNH